MDEDCKNVAIIIICNIFVIIVMVFNVLINRGVSIL